MSYSLEYNYLDVGHSFVSCQLQGMSLATSYKQLHCFLNKSETSSICSNSQEKSIEAPNMNKVSLIYWQNLNHNCNLYIKNSLMMLYVLHKVLKCTHLSRCTYTCFVQSQMAATKGSRIARAHWIDIDASIYPNKPQKPKLSW